MIHSIVRIFEFIAILGCVSSSIYYFICLWSAASFCSERQRPSRSP